jgi:hypothetical protein
VTIVNKTVGISPHLYHVRNWLKIAIYDFSFISQFGIYVKSGVRVPSFYARVTIDSSVTNDENKNFGPVIVKPCMKLQYIVKQNDRI